MERQRTKENAWMGLKAYSEQAIGFENATKMRHLLSASTKDLSINYMVWHFLFFFFSKKPKLALVACIVVLR